MRNDTLSEVKIKKISKFKYVQSLSLKFLLTQH